MKNAEIGEVSLIQVLPDGRICQLAMSIEQHRLLQSLVGSLSGEEPLRRAPKKYDLKLVGE